jgi:hypothetical protein
MVQGLLQKFEFLPIKSRIKLAAENFRLYQADLQADIDFWGPATKTLKAKVCPLFYQFRSNLWLQN